MITLKQVYECLKNEDSSFIGKILCEKDRVGFYRSNENELESSDWFENEGGRELVIDNNGKILYGVINLKVCYTISVLTTNTETL